MAARLAGRGVDRDRAAAGDRGAAVAEVDVPPSGMADGGGVGDGWRRRWRGWPRRRGRSWSGLFDFLGQDRGFRGGGFRARVGGLDRVGAASRSRLRSSPSRSRCRPRPRPAGDRRAGVGEGDRAAAGDGGDGGGEGDRFADSEGLAEETRAVAVAALPTSWVRARGFGGEEVGLARVGGLDRVIADRRRSPRSWLCRSRC